MAALSALQLRQYDVAAIEDFPVSSMDRTTVKERSKFSIFLLPLIPRGARGNLS